MVILNNSTESLSTAVWGRRFQSTVVRGENEAFLCCVLQSGTWYDQECMFMECLRGGESLSLLLTATLSWEILYIMTRRASLRRSSRLRHSRCCSMSPTLDVLRCLLVTYLAVMVATVNVWRNVFNKWEIIPNGQSKRTRETGNIEKTWRRKTQHNMCWTPLYASKHK